MPSDHRAMPSSVEMPLSGVGTPFQLSYTIRGFPQAEIAHVACTTGSRQTDSLSGMPNAAEWKRRIGARLKELRGWSLVDLERKTGGRLLKSRLSNYEQGTRLVSVKEAEILAEALGEAPAHVLCLDDDMPALSKSEAQLIADLRALPEKDRAQYASKISALALAHKLPVPDERVLRTAYNPDNRPAEAATPKKRPAGRHDQ